MSKQLGVSIVLLVAACGARPPATITRTVGGERRTGPFVSPYAYEHFVRAELAAARGDDQGAIQEYEMARLGPEDDVLVIARLAEALDRLGLTQRADRALDEGEELDGESEALWLARARILARRGEPERAMHAAVRAVAFAPQSVQPLLLLASLLETADATPRSDAVLQQAGDSPVALRARLTAAIARRDGPAAAEALEQLLRVAPARAQDITAIIRLSLEAGHPALTLHLLSHLDARAHGALRARALISAGRHSAAEALLRTTPPEAFGGPGLHAELLLRAGLTQAAAEAAESAAALGDVEALVVLGQARLQTGDAPGAAEAFARVPSGSRLIREARAGLGIALESAALPSLAQEVEADPPAGIATPRRTE